MIWLVFLVENLLDQSMGEELYRLPVRTRDAIVESLLGLDFAKLDKGVALGALRGYALAFIRGGGAPGGGLRERVIGQLDAVFPAGEDDDLNRELLRVLVYLDAPGVVDKGMALVTSNSRSDWNKRAVSIF